MQVIPAINETDFEEIKKKIKSAQDFGASWVHLDVSDGKFTGNLLWNNPKDLKNLYPKPSTLNPKLEIHLMVQNPDAVLDEWLDAGAKRIIVHLEAGNLTKSHFVNEVGLRNIEEIKLRCHIAGVELYIAVNPDTPAEKLFEYEKLADGFLILAVTPGKASQKFSAGGGSTEGGQEYQLKKIRTLRQKIPNAKIEADGGVNLENALAIKDAGADILVSASAIWGNADPAGAYKKFIEL